VILPPEGIVLLSIERKIYFGWTGAVNQEIGRIAEWCTEQTKTVPNPRT
jgi:hypothetical protein